jgi:hypothetical protein
VILKNSPEEQLLVRERVNSLTECIQQKAIQSLRGRKRGKAVAFQTLGGSSRGTRPAGEKMTVQTVKLAGKKFVIGQRRITAT